MILTYHKIFPEVKTKWWVTPDTFYRQMVDLKNKQVVYLDDYDPNNPNHAVITFDGIYQNMWEYAVPILKHFGYPFELFIIGKTIGGDNAFDSVEPLTQFADAETLTKLIEAGGRLQWHTWSHARLNEDDSLEKINQELDIPEEIRSLDFNGFKWFAYPHGDVSESIKEHIVARFKGALAVDHGNRADLYELPRKTVYEDTRLGESKISVVIPCYNYGHFVGEAIESVLYQTYPADEVLVIDDASTDDSVEIASFYEPRINVVQNPANMGIIENFKKAISLVSGDYICFLGADNRFRSDYLEKCKLVLDSDPGIGIAYTNIVIFGDRAGIMSAGSQIATEHDVIPGIYVRHYPENPDYDIKERNYIHGSSMYKRIAYDEVGGYSKSETTEDHDLFTRILAHGWKAKLVPEPVLEYRQHSVSQANRVHGLSVKNALLTKRVNQLNLELKLAKRQIERLRAAPKQVDELISARYRLFPVSSRREKTALFVLDIVKRGYRFTKKVLKRMRNSMKGSNG